MGSGCSDGLEQRVLDAYDKLSSATAVSRELGIPYHRTIRILKNNGVRLKRGRRPVSQVSEEAALAAFEKLGTVSAVSKELGVSYGVANRVLKNNGVELKRGGRPTGTKRFPERDALVAQGLTLQEIADEVEVTREAIRQYIKKSCQYDSWREARERAKFDEAFLRGSKSRLASQIRAVAFRKAEELGPAHVYALRHHYRHPYSLDYDRVLPLFELYFEGVGSDDPPSLQKLADAADLKYASNAQKILNAAGLSAFNERRQLPDELRWAIVRGLDVEPFSVDDIAFFVGCHPGNIHQGYQTESRERASGFYVHRYGGHSHFSLRQASMVYESLDAGFDLDETADIVGKPLEVVEYIADNREDIGQKIIDGLGYMFSDDAIDRPYLPVEFKKLYQ